MRRAQWSLLRSAPVCSAPSARARPLRTSSSPLPFLTASSFLARHGSLSRPAVLARAAVPAAAEAPSVQESAPSSVGRPSPFARVASASLRLLPLASAAVLLRPALQNLAKWVLSLSSPPRPAPRDSTRQNEGMASVLNRHRIESRHRCMPLQRNHAAFATEARARHWRSALRSDARHHAMAAAVDAQQRASDAA